jgi:hypothetical protein
VFRRLIEIARQHELRDQPVGSTRQAVAKSGFDVKGFALVIDDAEQLLRLLIERKQVLKNSVISVFFDSYGPGLVNIVRQPNRRGKIKIFELLPGIVHDRIDDEIKFFQMPANDRSYFRRVGVRIPMLGVVAKFEIDAVEEGPRAA